MVKILSSLTDSNVVTMLKHGAVGVLPSDTVYGLMCRAADSQAVTRLYNLKKREHKPGTIIAASIGQLVGLGLKRCYLTPVERFWPGAVSVVIPCGRRELDYLDQGLQSLAVRIPADKTLQAFIYQTGPLLTTSANLPGHNPAATIAEAQRYFGDSVDFYVDGGDLGSRQASTVIRMVDDAIEILRPGSIPIDEAGRMG